MKKASQVLSSTNYFVTAESASFRFGRGLDIRKLRVFERRNPTADPVLSADRIELDLNLRKLPWSAEHLLKAVTITKLRYPRLPKSYYIPDSIEFPGRPDFQETNIPIALKLPRMAPFRLKLLYPEILDLFPTSVEADRVALDEDILSVRGIHIKWIDADLPLSLDGEMDCSFGNRQLVQGEVRGTSHPARIYPMLQALEITNSYQFITAFTDIAEPVPAICRFNVNLRNGDLHLHLNLHPVGGKHHGVPIRDVAGTLDIRVFVRDTFQNAHIHVGPLMANIGDGNTLSGAVFYENTNDVGFVTFRDVRSTTSLSNSLAIADILTDGTLDCLQPGPESTITVDGRLAVDPVHAATNDLHCTLDFKAGKLFSIPLRDAHTALHLKGTDVHFMGTRAKTVHGGTVTGDALISLPDFQQTNATFNVNVRTDAMTLRDLTDILGFDPGDRHGTVNADVTLAGPLQTNLASHIRGHGWIVCRDGRLAEHKVLSGLTSALSKIPGVSKLFGTPSNGLMRVTFDRGKMDFSLADGQLSSTNIVIDGSALSIHAAGTYDLVHDKLDYKARVYVLPSRDKKLLSQIMAPLSFVGSSLTKRLFDFHIFGPLDDPKWEHTDLVDRLK